MPRLLTGLLLWALVSQCLATMQVDRAIVHFPAGQPPRQDVVIRNPDDTPLFVDVRILTVTHAGTAQEKRELVKDPNAVSLIATPRRVMVPPGGLRRVRLVNLGGNGKSERVYRVDLKPVSGSEHLDKTGIRIMIGYQLLVFIDPQTPEDKLTSQRDGRTLTITNQGNENVVLHNGKQCPSSPSTQDCRDVEGKRLYPGNSLKLDLPFDTPVEFSVSSAEHTRRQRFP
ncbi:MAG: fimbria/pilus periplasmic chaperone [Alcanivorax sp.]|nr:fimbria/pilus periplasmic chaperone [Alcanivorax sp.]